MKDVKKNNVLVCSECGIELEVTKNCERKDCEVICCGKPMNLKDETSGRCCC